MADQKKQQNLDPPELELGLLDEDHPYVEAWKKGYYGELPEDDETKEGTEEA